MEYAMMLWLISYLTTAMVCDLADYCAEIEFNYTCKAMIGEDRYFQKSDKKFER